ncbi:hypothetical protein ACFX2I_026979 [Malus domestica]
MTRFRATTAAVISFFTTESPTVRGPVGDMKDGRHMLFGEEGIASSPRFKSKRRSEGPNIFKMLKKEKIGQIKILEVQEGSFHKRKFKCALKRTTCLYKKSALDGISEIEEASSEFEGANSKIKEVLAFSKAGLAKKKPRAIFISRLVRICHMQPLHSTKLRNRRGILLFQTHQHPLHANSALRKSRVICRNVDPRYRRGASLFSRVNTCHMHTQLCANHG